VELRARALVIAPDQLFTAHSKRLAELALQHALPAIYEFRQFVAAGFVPYLITSADTSF
jgi:putative tryptophan/tyrosine transport system substrate-binding protein